jgi:nitric oxide reductase NorQ protein
MIGKILGQDENIALIKLAVTRNLPVLIIGETGCGKTQTVKEIAQEMGKRVVRFSITGETSVDEIIGKYTLENNQTVWNDGVLLKAMKDGDWFVMDEVNAALSEILFVLHALLDDDRAVNVTTHNSEIVRPHEDFRFFATMNPPEEYSGTKELNKAFLSRFPIILDMGYPEPAIETRVVMEQAGVDQNTAVTMVEAAGLMRRAKKAGEIFYTCSTRDLIQWGRLVPDVGLEKAFKAAIGNKAKADEVKINEIMVKAAGAWEALVAKHGKTALEQFEAEFEEFSKKKSKLKEAVLKELLEKLGGEPKEKKTKAKGE